MEIHIIGNERTGFIWATDTEKSLTFDTARLAGMNARSRFPDAEIIGEFSRKFSQSDETGAFVFAADSPSHRFDDRSLETDNIFETERMRALPARDQDDDLSRGSYGNREWAKEKALINSVTRLQSITHRKPTRYLCKIFGETALARLLEVQGALIEETIL